ncbi:Stressosome protein RsbRA [Thiorhodovibrio winogradskyi]|uniref:Stressosome protein RsbRA n=1 Tax=Thiorhodovibrio winogradskyi TaxID=77007 RepID=A0ABZ0S4C9_9GAMM|nr:STAS domain-containing protein [Thiorhodovibrio winogradskyi]
MTSLFDQLQDTALLDEWRQGLPATTRSTGLDTRELLAPLYLAIMKELKDHEPPFALAEAPAALTEALRAWVAAPARTGGSPTEPIVALLGLKQLLLREIGARAPAELSTALARFERVFDALTLLTFETFAAVRERLINAQSASLMELSTPVLRLWHQVLLLPLIGVVDTQRASQITESLLEAIVQYEARVTILDLSGVPVLDTSVAQHLMKTIDAARLLGTRIVMTGISPEGAQTLTKLGIRFNDVISRATLRAGIAEALLMVGRRIAPLSGAGTTAVPMGPPVLPTTLPPAMPPRGGQAS